MLPYLGVYERALIKYMHYFKVGREGAPARDGLPSITPFIMGMQHVQEMGFDQLMTSTLLPDDEQTKVAQAQWWAARDQHGLEPLKNT